MTSVTPAFSSLLAPAFARYVDLKRALGRRFDVPLVRCNPWTDSSVTRPQRIRT